MFLVGLSGGIASGKSTVSKMFLEGGCPIIDADIVAREVVEPGKPAWKKIKQRFGNDIIKEDGTIDREQLGQIIFMDPAKRRLLNSITHPQIFRAMMWQIFVHFLKGHPYVILDVPLLFESGTLLRYIHTTLVVNCDEQVQIRRLMERNNYSAKDAEQRINSQLPLAEKCRRATHVINNNGSIEETRVQVNTIHNTLKSCRAHWRARAVLLLVVGVLVMGTKYFLKYFRFL